MKGSTSSHYIIRGGNAGRERLRLLSRVMQDATSGLLSRLAIASGSVCLDAGCGGGDVSKLLAERVGPGGRVVGEDIDSVKLELAAAEAAAEGLRTIEYRQADVFFGPLLPEYDLIYVRFLLTHLPNAEAALDRLTQRLRPGGRLVIEDIDFSGHVCLPAHDAFWRYHELHILSMQRRGGDANIGLRLPGMLQARGFHDIGVTVAQPLGLTGEAKRVPAVTMENIGPAVLEDNLISEAELAALVHDLYLLAEDEHTLTGMPRVFQTWGTR